MYKDKILYTFLSKNKYGGYLKRPMIDKNVIEIIISKMHLSKSSSMAQLLEININNLKNISKKEEILSNVILSFDTQKHITQYNIDNYNIELYFPDYKLAVEYEITMYINNSLDSDAKLQYEITHEKKVKREQYIKKKLQCTFIKFNSDSKNFCIFNLINKIQTHITNYIKKYT
jgi:hypothetical protein